MTINNTGCLICTMSSFSLKLTHYWDILGRFWDIFGIFLGHLLDQIIHTLMTTINTCCLIRSMSSFSLKLTSPDSGWILNNFKLCGFWAVWKPKLTFPLSAKSPKSFILVTTCPIASFSLTSAWKEDRSKYLDFFDFFVNYSRVFLQRQLWIINYYVKKFIKKSQ